MNNVINYLEKWKDEVNQKLAKEKSKELIELKHEIQDAISGLKFIAAYDIQPKKIVKIVELPETKTGYSEFRILNDCEVDNRDLWKEVTINGEPLRINVHDIIIMKK